MTLAAHQQLKEVHTCMCLLTKVEAIYSVQTPDGRTVNYSVSGNSSGTMNSTWSIRKNPTTGVVEVVRTDNMFF